MTDTAKTPAEITENVLEQRNQSLIWFNENYYGELAEIYRNINCRVKPVLGKDGKEITTRTNICLPDHFVMVRRGTARLTAQPPDLRVTGGTQEQRDKVSAMLMWQWDRSREQRTFRQVVHQAKAFGWSVEKTYWDKVEVVRRLRRATARLNLEDLLRLKDMPEDAIQQQVEAAGGPGAMPADHQITQAMAEFGPEVTLPVPTLKYEGPVGERVFIGDIFVEPGFRSLQRSSFVIESSERDENWLKFWLNQKTTTPDGEELPVMDVGAVEQLLQTEGEYSEDTAKVRTLRRELRQAIGQSEPIFDPRLRGKRYLILERHSFEDGRGVIDWIADRRNLYLGRMWYPWDTYGRYIFNEMVLIPDLLGGIGQSTPRVSRFLMQMRNARGNQRTDFINRKLRPVFTEIDTADITDEAFERSGWSAVKVKSHDDLRLLVDPQFPAETLQDEASLVREMQQVDPASADFAPGTRAVPEPGQLATTAILQQKSSDVVTADELHMIDDFVRDVLELRLAMTQQAMREAYEVQSGVASRIDALSQRLAGQTGPRTIRVDPLEIQEDFEIIPETGSTLAADDEFKRSAVERFFAAAAANPQVFNVRAAATKLVQTIPGITPDEALAPEPGPQPPEIRVSVNVAVKWPELPADIQAAIAGAAGLPTEGLQAEEALKIPEKLAGAAEAVDRLHQPAGLPTGGPAQGVLPGAG